MRKGIRDRQRNHVYLPDRVRFMEQGWWSLGRTLRSNLEEVEPQKLRGLSLTYPDESFGAQNSFETFSRRPSFIRLNRRETSRLKASKNSLLLAQLNIVLLFYFLTYSVMIHLSKLFCSRIYLFIFYFCAKNGRYLRTEYSDGCTF